MRGWVALFGILFVGCSTREATKRPLEAHPGIATALARAVPLVRTPSGIRIEPRTGWQTTGALDVTLPIRADGATRIAVGTDAFLAVRPLDVASVESTIETQRLVARSIAKATDVVHLVEPTRVEELRILHDPSAEPVVRERIDLGPGLSRLRLRDGRIEALDERGVVRIASEPMIATDAAGTTRALAVALETDARGGVLTAKLDTAKLAHPIAIDPAWTATATVMSTNHQPTHSFLLASGKVLVVGGTDTKPDLYDPTLGYWFSGGTMASTHGYDIYSPLPAVALPSGRILVAAGNMPGGPTSTAEIYDPATNAWTAAAPLSAPRTRHALVVLSSGKVLAVGGQNAGTAFSSTEIYDPAANTWAPGPSSNVAHDSPGVIALASGKVLLAGGSNAAAGGATSVAEIYDPAAGTWTFTGSMSAPRMGMRTVLLPSGKVLLFGGGSSFGSSTNVAEIYDPATGKFTASSAPGGSSFLSAGQAFLPSGKLLAMALPQPGATYPFTSLYDPATDTWARGADFPGANLQGAWPVLLPDGTVLSPNGSDNMAAIYNDGFALAATCAKDSDCASNHCADGVCCNAACTAQCQACAEPGSVGTCATVTGKPRGGRAACPGSGPCGAACDGVSTSCTYPDVTKTCITPSCTAGVATPASSCDGAGNCPAAATISCALYACGAVSCKTTCAVDGDCAGAAYCDTTTSKCVAKKSAGGACAGDSACKPASDGAGHCSVGVCCDRACDGICEACDLSGSVGVCSPRASVTACGTTGCSAGTLTTAGHCSGTDGTCVLGSSSPCPAHFACADATSCKTSCTTASDCVSGYDCVSGSCVAVADAGSDTGTDASVVDTGTITDTGATPDTMTTDGGSPLPDPEKVPRVGAFTACTQASDCTSGNCVQGVCCDSPCTDKCKTCLLPSSPGKCVFSPFGVDLKHDCGPDLSCIATCDGKGGCASAGPGTLCARNACTGRTTGIGPAYCTGNGEACPKDVVFPFDCMPYTCEVPFGACRTTCSSSDHCGPGYACDLASGRCVNDEPPPDDGSGCAMASSRSTSFGLAVALLGLFRTARRRAARRPSAR